MSAATQLLLPFAITASADPAPLAPAFVAGLAEMFADSARWLDNAVRHCDSLQQKVRAVEKAHAGGRHDLRDCVPFLFLRGAWGNAALALDLPRPGGC